LRQAKEREPFPETISSPALECRGGPCCTGAVLHTYILNARCFWAAFFWETVKMPTRTPSRGLHTRLSRHAQRGVCPERKLWLTITGSLAGEKSRGTLSQALEKERVQHADRLPIESDESFLSAS
jgi:hypothetical protein